MYLKEVFLVESCLLIRHNSIRFYISMWLKYSERKNKFYKSRSLVCPGITPPEDTFGERMREEQAAFRTPIVFEPQNHLTLPKSEYSPWLSPKDPKTCQLPEQLPNTQSYCSPRTMPPFWLRGLHIYANCLAFPDSCQSPLRCEGGGTPPPGRTLLRAPSPSSHPSPALPFGIHTSSPSSSPSS